MSVGMWIFGILLLFATALRAQPPADHLPGTSRLTAAEEFFPLMVAGIDRALDRQLEETVAKRTRFWRRDSGSPAAYTASVAPNRARLQQIMGAVDERRSPVTIEYVGGPHHPALLAETERVRVFAVRWAVFEGVNGEGLLLEPKDRVRARIVALPDADELPEALAGMIAGGNAWALRLAESGCEVIVPALLDRRATWSGNPRIAMTDQTHREWIWRQSYELGRHPIGFEVQTVRAVLDAWAARSEKLPVGVAGYGEGGLIALYASAIDPRVDAALVSGYFQRREELWREPIYRRVFGLLKEFGDGDREPGRAAHAGDRAQRGTAPRRPAGGGRAAAQGGGARGDGAADVCGGPPRGRAGPDLGGRCGKSGCFSVGTGRRCRHTGFGARIAGVA